ncbi:hypothetical protein [Paenibacillus sp. GXUN7292]|uniref:hypothetical protein n=1 Tax=Paenibacillus sp. GXUN7292 TaxID=3422499 RepID=UPI003D7C713D
MHNGFYRCSCGEITVVPGKRHVIDCPACYKMVQPADRITDADWGHMSRYQILLLMKGCFLISSDFEFELEERYLNWDVGTSVAQILDELEERYEEAKEFHHFRVCCGPEFVEVYARSPVDAADKVFEMKEWDTVFVLDSEGPHVYKRSPESYLVLNEG